MENEALTAEQQDLKDLVETNRRHLQELIRRCAAQGHVVGVNIVRQAVCRVCDEPLGRYCQKSPTHICHHIIDEDGHAYCHYCQRP